MKLQKIFVYAIPFFYLLLLLFQQDLALTEDLGRHITIGNLIVHCLCVPRENLFSYTQPNFPWVDNSWLSQVIFYLSYKIFGITSLLIIKLVLIIVSFFLIYSQAIKRGTIFWATI